MKYKTVLKSGRESSQVINSISPDNSKIIL